MVTFFFFSFHFSALVLELIITLPPPLCLFVLFCKYGNEEKYIPMSINFFVPSFYLKKHTKFSTVTRLVNTAKSLTNAFFITLPLAPTVFITVTVHQRLTAEDSLHTSDGTLCG